MVKSNETWTRTHDLALVYIALVFGGGTNITDAILTTVIKSLQKWDEKLSVEEVKEVVLEALAIYMTDDAHVEFTRTVRSLNKQLNKDERKKALEDVLQIAEADGVLQSSERSLITLLAENWDLKDTGTVMLEQSSATIDEHPSWSLLHDMTLICVVLAHSTDNDLSPAEIDKILERLHSWQPDLSKEELRAVLGDAIQAYAAQPGSEMLSNCLSAIKESLPIIQRVAFIDDLVAIAQVDDGIIDTEREMIRNVSEALGV